MSFYNVRQLYPNQPVTTQEEQTEQISNALEESNLRSRV